jgi:hypothetical protein
MQLVVLLPAFPLDFVVNQTETRTATIFMDANSIVQIVLKEDVAIDYEDALDNYLVVKHLTGNRPALKLIDARSNARIKRKAWKFIKSKEVKEKTIARATVKRWGPLNVPHNLLLQLTGSVPLKVFTNYDKAYAWLLSKL